MKMCKMWLSSEESRLKEKQLSSENISTQKCSKFGNSKQRLMSWRNAFYCVLFFNVFLPVSCAETDDLIKKIAVVGKIFSIDENAQNTIIAYPIWILPENETQSNAVNVYSGIPQLEHLGESLIVTEQEDNQLIEVVEETTTECGEGVTTTWIELLYTDNLNNLTILNQIKTVEKVFDAIQTAIQDTENSRSDFRVFPFSYLARYRTIAETISDDFDITDADNNRLVVVLNISCGELTEYASEVINVLAENSVMFRVVQGDLNTNRKPVETTTLAPINQSLRTTRQISDNKPVAFNRLSAFQCKRGILCRFDIGENTFIDAEDGSTSRLRLTIYSIDEFQNFLVALPFTTQIEGIALEAGTYKFRVEARDRLNQTASLPFQVNVENSPKSNHEFIMTLDTSLKTFKSHPNTLSDFVYRISASLRGQKNILPLSAAVAAASSVRVSEVIESGPTQIVVRWSNITLSRRICQERHINDTRALMLAGKNFDRVRHDFRRNMGSQFHVKKIVVELFSSCLITPTKVLEGFRVRATTVENFVNAEPTPGFTNSLMILIIFLAVFLLFVSLLTVFFCMHSKHGLQKKKQQHNNYVSKGLPVVFPEEVPQDDDVIADVTTPMLVSREHPPLDPTRMTLHENLLYKPPPTAQAQLKQLPAVNPTSTFSTPISGTTRPSLLLSSGGSLAGVVSQRLPPPYMAQI